MGSGNSGLFKGTKGSTRLPKGDAQLKHIFRNDIGHLPDTPTNRQKLVSLARDESKYRGTDKDGNRWYIEESDDGGQYWVRKRNGIINEGGYNNPPRQWDPKTGLNRNPIRRKKNG